MNAGLVVPRLVFTRVRTLLIHQIAMEHAGEEVSDKLAVAGGDAAKVFEITILPRTPGPPLNAAIIFTAPRQSRNLS
jgi:hypothetical protein